MSLSIVEEIEQIKQKGLFRRTRLISGRQSKQVCLNGADVMLLCSNNYLGLAEHPALCDASIRAVERFGTSSGASRLVSGNMELHEELEQAVADFKQTATALLFNSGYAANTGIISGLVGRGDVIFSDRLNHASIIDGSMLSGAKVYRYQHNDTEMLATMLEKHRGNGRCLIVTDGVFSMDGDIAHLPRLVELKKHYSAMLMVDDAHGCGVLGENGRGTAELAAVMDDVDIHMGTLGKALASFGAYAGLSSELRDLLVNRSRSFIFSTSLPPAVLAASIAAIKIVCSDEGRALRKRLAENTILFRSLLHEAGFDTGSGTTQIVPVISGEAELTMQYSDSLLKQGFFVQGIRPPTVPAGSCRLRCTLMATHSADDLSRAAEAIIKTGKRLRVI